MSLLHSCGAVGHLPGSPLQSHVWYDGKATASSQVRSVQSPLPGISARTPVACKKELGRLCAALASGVCLLRCRDGGRIGSAATSKGGGGRRRPKRRKRGKVDWIPGNLLAEIVAGVCASAKDGRLGKDEVSECCESVDPPEHVQGSVEKVNWLKVKGLIRNVHQCKNLKAVLLRDEGLSSSALADLNKFKDITVMWCATQDGRRRFGLGFGKTPMCSREVAAQALLKQLEAATGSELKTASKQQTKETQEEVPYDVQSLYLDNLGSGQAALRKLIGSSESVKLRAQALTAACDRQAQFFADEELIDGDDDAELAGGHADFEEDGPLPFEHPPKRRYKVKKEPEYRLELLAKLPASCVREQLARALSTNQVVIVSGGTGSGKSTQLPQFILDDFQRWDARPQWLAKELRPPQVVVTQPRRVAAVSLAERVAWERQQEEGFEVGHAVRGDRVRPTSTRGFIEYCTVGTLLRRNLSDPMLSRFNVIVMDEVHERDINTDFLLIILRELLEKRPDMRLVLMSATVDVQVFREYMPKARLIDIPAGPRCPVQEVYLDDSFFSSIGQAKVLLEGSESSLGEMKKLKDEARQLEAEEAERASSAEVVDALDAWLGSSSSTPAEKRQTEASTRKRSQEVDDVKWWAEGTRDAEQFIDLVTAAVLKLLPEMEGLAQEIGGVEGSMLVFLPGWAEIQKVMDNLERSPQAEQLWILPLHSSLPKDKQAQIFETAPEGLVKIILATNIAESSVTIDDVLVVVDSGLHRLQTYDSENRLSSLDTVWVSQSNAVQRKGRAGRVREGVVYRLYSKEQFEAMPWRAAPQMQRSDLCGICLQVVALGRDPRKFLASAPDPPSDDAIEVAMAELMAIGALKDMPLEMLPLGYFLSRLPLHPLHGRAMVLGSLFGVPFAAAAMLSVSTGRSIFSVPAEPERRREARELRRSFCSWSDTVASVKALAEFEAKVRDRGLAAASEWARGVSMDPIALKTRSRVKFQLLQEVQKGGLVGINASEDELGAALSEYTGYVGVGGKEAGAIFEASDLTTTGLSETEWLREIGGPSAPDVHTETVGVGTDEVVSDEVLSAILCSASPANVSFLRRDGKFYTRAGKQALIESRSVIDVSSRQAPVGNNEQISTPWVMYQQLRMFGGQTFLSNATFLKQWQVALFAGLQLREASSGAILLDDWIHLLPKDHESKAVLDVVRLLRQEIQDGITWASLAAFEDNTAKAARDRSAALCQVLSSVLAREPLPREQMAFIENFRMPTLVPKRLKDRNMRRQEIERVLWSKPLRKLKAELRQMGLNTNGSKAALVERCALGMVAQASEVAS